MRRRRATVQWRQLVNWREAVRCGEWAQRFSNASCYSIGDNDNCATLLQFLFCVCYKCSKGLVGPLHALGTFLRTDCMNK